MKAFAACLLPFLLLATLNSAGYRYGASDQAFYIPAVLLQLNPSLFPRDRAVLAAQAPLTGADEIVAAVVRATHLSVPAACAVLHLLTLILIASAALAVARVVYRTSWAGVALLAALTLRHAVPDSGTNTLEGYFHPRQLAFGLGVLAVAVFLRRRPAAAGLVLAGAAALHPTTAMWFAICIGVAAFVADRALRPALSIAAALAAAAAAWAVTAGPLAARVTIMDDAWLAALAGKDYIFPLRWSWDAWLINLAYAPAILWMYRARERAGLTTPQERGLVAGCLALVAVFAVAVPLTAARVALAVQLQPGRVFLVLDFLTVVYAVWWLGEGASARLRRAQWLTAAVVLASVVRAGYQKLVLFPDRPVAQVYVRDDDWGRVMAWAQTTDVASGWLADPLHAAVYGTSLRLAGHRDVLVEAFKDAALGMYDRDVALRTQERFEAIRDYHLLTAARARALAAQYALDYFITEQALDLPIAFSSGRVFVYTIR
jgi:hypothetical protein